jgi:hypothetical protein
MNPQSEALRKCAHFLRSLRAQSNSPARFADEEPAAAEALATVEAALAAPIASPVAPLLEFASNNLTDEAADVAGALIAEALSCKRSIDFPDRWVTGWGTKTNRGLARTLLHVIAEACDDVNPKLPGAVPPATAPEPEPVKVAVHIEGGLIQGVIASAPVEWIALDTEDYRSAEDDDKMAFAPDGELARLTGCPGCVHLACFEPASISPEAIKEIEE